MKTLYLVRHSKSSWDDGYLEDINRHLKSSGVYDAVQMSKYLHEKNIVPEAIISSNAIRAMSTALIFAKQFNFHLEHFMIEPRVYQDGADKLVKLIEKVNNKYNSLMLFGHNPSLTDLLNRLTQSAIVKIPTTGLAGITFDTDTWKGLAKTTGSLSFFISPGTIR